MKKTVSILIMVIVGLSCIPFGYAHIRAKGQWQDIVPSFVNDDLYYYARMENIAHGYPFIGNPYFFEHRNELSPAFFVSDWISTIPLKLGLPLAGTVIFNFIFWSLVFSLLMYTLFRQCDLSSGMSLLGTILSYEASYILLLRPVSMQIVAPFFVLFCIAFSSWMSSQAPALKQKIFLVLAIASSFYIYTYLWQVVVATLGLSFLFLLYRKDWFKLKSLCVVSFAGVSLALPAVAYTFKQISSPFYWESMARIGLVNTHIPTVLSFYDGVMIFAVLVLWMLTFLWFEKVKKNNHFRQTLVFLLLSGLGLVFALFSNVVTGKELEISNHVERFVIIWISFAVILYAGFLNKFRPEFKPLISYKKVIAAFFLAFSVAVFTRFLRYGFGLDSILKTDVSSVQAYAEPLAWLDKNTPKESVVWANGGVRDYITTYTSDFELWNPAGGLHLVSDKEVEERYLVSHYFDNLSLLDIESDFREYAGVGNSIHQYKTYNRKVKICNLLHLPYFGIDCGSPTSATAFRGEKYFVDLYNQYKNNIKSNISLELKKFNVEYIVKDKQAGGTFTPEKLSNARLVWTNGRFEVYRLY